MLNIIETRQIFEKLNEIKEELDFIKDRIIDVYLVMTDDDINSLIEAEKDLKEGKTKRLYA
ncbi:MAG: hypothetical protein V1663_03125 [archaeon]